jgi:transcriptional regulator with XRE-family HTH domain
MKPVSEPAKKVGTLIKNHRKSLGMNQTEYAKLIGAGRYSTISSWEIGDREAPYRVIFRVLKELGLFNLEEVL